MVEAGYSFGSMYFVDGPPTAANYPESFGVRGSHLNPEGARQLKIPQRARSLERSSGKVALSTAHRDFQPYIDVGDTEIA